MVKFFIQLCFNVTYIIDFDTQTDTDDSDGVEGACMGVFVWGGGPGIDSLGRSGDDNVDTWGGCMWARMDDYDGGEEGAGGVIDVYVWLKQKWSEVNA